MKDKRNEPVQEERVGPFTRIGSFIDEYWPILLVAAGGVGMVFVGDLLPQSLEAPAWKDQWLSVVGALAILSTFVVGNISVYKRTSRANALYREKDALEKIIRGFGDDYFDIWRTKLGHTAKTLGFGDQERVSIYRYSEQDRTFYMLGRYSEGPDFARRGRAVYPEDQGCIGRAWRTGEGIAQELPDPEVDYDNYERAMSDGWNIDRDTLRAMAMKSRLICAIAIRDRTDLRRIAVVVFESTRVNGFALDDVRSFVTGIEGREMAHLIEVLQSLEPSPHIATSRGF